MAALASPSPFACCASASRNSRSASTKSPRTCVTFARMRKQAASSSCAAPPAHESSVAARLTQRWAAGSELAMRCALPIRAATAACSRNPPRPTVAVGIALSATSASSTAACDCAPAWLSLNTSSCTRAAASNSCCSHERVVPAVTASVARSTSCSRLTIPITHATRRRSSSAPSASISESAPRTCFARATQAARHASDVCSTE
mmetsp:Transcript_26715/g.92809  ORF Transcript_26715/g.92809 Transcript_26715/m.92809 type:complete len:204 (-) Transcript_26715:171-782(-)